MGGAFAQRNVKFRAAGQRYLFFAEIIGKGAVGNQPPVDAIEADLQLIKADATRFCHELWWQIAQRSQWIGRPQIDLQPVSHGWIGSGGGTPAALWVAVDGLADRGGWAGAAVCRDLPGGAWNQFAIAVEQIDLVGRHHWGAAGITVGEQPHIAIAPRLVDKPGEWFTHAIHPVANAEDHLIDAGHGCHATDHARDGIKRQPRRETGGLNVQWVIVRVAGLDSKGDGFAHKMAHGVDQREKGATPGHLHHLRHRGNASLIDGKEHPVARGQDIRIGVQHKLVTTGAGGGKGYVEEAQIRIEIMGDTGHFNEGEPS